MFECVAANALLGEREWRGLCQRTEMFTSGKDN